MLNEGPLNSGAALAPLFPGLQIATAQGAHQAAADLALTAERSHGVEHQGSYGGEGASACEAGHTRATSPVPKLRPHGDRRSTWADHAGRQSCACVSSVGLPQSRAAESTAIQAVRVAAKGCKVH